MEFDADTLLSALGGALVVFIVIALALVGNAIVHSPAASAPEPPSADWTLERVNNSHVRIVHAGGEPVEAEALVVTVNGYRRAVSWSGRLEEGDSGTLQAASGVLVRLYWTGGEGDRDLLARWRAP